ncbi:MAG: helix-turn-helix transcriptional regulator [Myxococcota bacterium]
MSKHIASKARLLRERRGWTQAQFAEIAGVSERTIQRVEEGRPAALETLRAIAAAFDLEVADLRENSSPPAAAPDGGAPGDRYEVIPLERLRRGSDLGRLLSGCHALHFAAPSLEDDASEDKAAALNQTLMDWLDLWGDLGPLERRNAEKSIQGDLDDLERRGLVATGGRRLVKAKSGSELVSLDVAYVLVSKRSEVQLFAIYDRSQPVRFG